MFNRPVGRGTMTGGPAGSTNDYFLWPQGALTLISPGGYDRLTFLAAGLDLKQDKRHCSGGGRAGSTVALNGFFEELGGFDDVVIAASNTIVQGGAARTL